MKTKKSIYDYFTYSIYKYAPESFKICFMGKNIRLSSQDALMLGNAILRGKQEGIKVLKQFIRNHSVFTHNRNTFKTLAIRTNEGENTYIKISSNWGYGRVNIFDIQQKLDVFKAIKEAYNRNNFNVQVTTGIMQEYGKMGVGVTQEIEKPKLLNRIIYI